MNTEQDPDDFPETENEARAAGIEESDGAELASEGGFERVAREITSDEGSIDGGEKGLIYPGPGA